MTQRELTVLELHAASERCQEAASSEEGCWGTGGSGARHPLRGAEGDIGWSLDGE